MSVIFEEETIKNNKDFNLNTNKNLQKISFQDLMKVYYYKLDKLKQNFDFKSQVDRLWNMLPKSPMNDITKSTFIVIFRKIFLFLLPYYNRHELDTYVEEEFSFLSNGANINYEQFTDYLFLLIHTWTTHINKYEYTSLLKLIINRIIQKRNYYLNGKVH